MPRDIPVSNGQMLVTFDEKYQIRDVYYPHVGQDNHVAGNVCHFGVYGSIQAAKANSQQRKKALDSMPEDQIESGDPNAAHQNTHHATDPLASDLHALQWTHENWDIGLDYHPETLATDVHLRHEALGVTMACCDLVDFHRPLFLRRIRLKNRLPVDRELVIFHQNNFSMYGNRLGDTAYFDPQLRTLIHYRGKRYLMAGWYAEGDLRMDEFATGNAGFGGAEGTFRDAEDGVLGRNPIAQGAVDSTMGLRLHLPPEGEQICYMFLGAGEHYQDLDKLHDFLVRETPATIHNRTTAYWQQWLAGCRIKLKNNRWMTKEIWTPDQSPSTATSPTSEGEQANKPVEKKQATDTQASAKEKTAPTDSKQTIAAEAVAITPDPVAQLRELVSPLNEKVIQLFHRSLLLVRSQIDNGGAIIAANDTDIMQFSRDTYSYMWPRDGALVAAAMDDAGFASVTRPFYQFLKGLIDQRGFFLHKYNPEGSLASSWHPWVKDGLPQLPIQEDETALVIWALWNHYDRYRDIEFVRPLWGSLIRQSADFLALFRDPVNKLPLPSYDLWEERFGIHAFTVGTVYGGLTAASHFAECFGDSGRADQYALAAEEIKEAFDLHFWNESKGHYNRRLIPMDTDRQARFVSEILAGKTRLESDDDPSLFENKAVAEGPFAFEIDPVLDSSTFAIFYMGMLPADHPRVEKTMRAVEAKLWIDTPVGGVARYQDDYYHAVEQHSEAVPGNPWFICTLWLALWHIQRAKNENELNMALPILDWVANHALPSGVLAEQVHPRTNAPLSVSPLTWSHATVVATVTAYLRKRDELLGQY